jgi:hypothetical protein
MENKVYSYYQSLPSWAKGVIVVGGAVIVSYAGFKLFRKIFPSAEEKKNKELAKNIDSEIQKNLSNGMKPSFSDAQYGLFANTVYDSMRYAIGDDYGKVVTVLKQMKNNLDVEKLIKVFGNKQNYVFGLPAGEPKDLFTFVSSELGNEYFGVTSYRVTDINKDWAKKGISYKI